jgi:multicomponent K+:H+ antiporter subunit A
MKVTLFFCAGIVAETLGVHRVSEMAGVGRRLPLTMGAFTVAAFGMIGVPPLAGFVSKWHLGLGARAGTRGWWRCWWRAASSTPRTSSPSCRTAWFARRGAVARAAAPRAGRRRWMLLGPAVATALLVVGAGLFAGSGSARSGWRRRAVGRSTADERAPLLFRARPAGAGWRSAARGGAGRAWRGRWPRGRRSPRSWSRSPPRQPRGVSLAPPGGAGRAGGGPAGCSSSSAFLWTVAGVYARAYHADDPARGRLLVFWLLTLSGNLGLAVAGDVVSFYLFFALMTFAAYGLVVHAGARPRRARGGCTS